MPAAVPETLEIGAIVTGLGGGLALFLFGMRQMTEGLKTVAGPSMKRLLARLTANRFTAALAGTIITAIIQSSSVTTVLLVGFVSAGVLTLNQSIGVIIGANIGTTITAQIIAFNVYKYGLVLIAIGFFTEVLAQTERIRQWGIVLMGLGLVFFGMELMSNAAVPLREWPPFVSLMQQTRSPLFAVLAGTVFTAIIQSSSATTGIVIVLAGQGMISLETGIGLILGANIGTCVTAILSAYGKPREAVQAALVHVLFNACGALFWLLFINHFADLVRQVSPSLHATTGGRQLAAEMPRQIANAHTMFNIVNAFIFIWFTGPVARLANWLVPARPVPVGVHTMYLDEMFIEQPSVALDLVRRELVRLAEMTGVMIEKSLQVATSGDTDDVKSLASADDDIDKLHGAIVTFLAKLSQKNLINPQPQQLHELLAIANYLENIGDVIDKSLLENARKRLKLGVAVSGPTTAVLRPIHEKVHEAFQRLIDAVRTSDRKAALDAIESKESVNQSAADATAHLARRLVASEPNRLAAFQVETDIIENLRHINTLTRRIAKTVLTGENDHPRSEEQSIAGQAQPLSGVELSDESGLEMSSPNVPNQE